MKNNFKVYIEYEVNNLWFEKDNFVYELKEDEIIDLVNYFIDDQMKNKKYSFYDYFKFEDFEFEESDLILDLNNSTEAQSLENALNDKYSKDGVLIGEAYIRNISLDEAENFIKCLIFEELLKRDQDFTNILDKNFFNELVITYKNKFRK